MLGSTSAASLPRRPLPASASGLRVALASAGVGLLAFLTVVTFGAPAAFAAQPVVNLGTVESYGVIAGSTITNTGSTSIEGDLALSPGTAVTGNPAVTGTQNVANPAAVKAKQDLTTAYTDAANAPSTHPVATDLAGQNLTQGVYTASSTMGLSGTLTLTGGADDVFIFQVGSDLTVGPGARVLLAGGVRACNVFWQVGGIARLDTGSTFVGTLLVEAQINMLTGATLQGRALVRSGQVTFDTNVITRPGSCAASSVSPTPTPSPSASPKPKPKPKPKPGTVGSGSGSDGSGSGTGSDSGSGSVIPLGHPETGEGGAVGPATNPWLLGGGAALGGAMLASGMAVRRTRRPRHSHR